MVGELGPLPPTASLQSEAAPTLSLTAPDIWQGSMPRSPEKCVALIVLRTNRLMNVGGVVWTLVETEGQ